MLTNRYIKLSRDKLFLRFRFKGLLICFPLTYSLKFYINILKKVV